MSGRTFPRALVVEALPDGRTWRTTAPFRYWYGPPGRGEQIEIPQGFRTDFATVPRWAWPIVPPYGKHTGAAVVHDWLYWLRDRPRERADQVFRVAMADAGVPWWRRELVFWAVRVFGGRCWRGRGANHGT